MKKFIELPKGDAIRADTIYAVRKGDAQPSSIGDDPIPPRVIVDFCPNIGSRTERFGGSANSVICYCATNEERDALAASILQQLQEVGSES